MSAIPTDVSLDALFRRNAKARPKDRALFSGYGRDLSYTDTENAVSHLCAQLAAMNLPPRSAVALLLPAGAELIVSLLAVMRCGHVAVLMPVAWRKSDLVRACREAEAIALITTVNFTHENLPQLAAEVAIEVFELSFPCAFGAELPDGILPLEFSTAPAPVAAAVVAPGIATMQSGPNGFATVLHRDEELLAAGLGALVATDLQPGDTIASGVSPSSYAGLASAFVPWLLSGGALGFLHDDFGLASAKGDRIHLVAPARVLPLVCGESDHNFASVTAVHFDGTFANSNLAFVKANRTADLFTIGEIGALALPRMSATVPRPIPIGTVHAGGSGAGAPVIIETMIDDKQRVHIRGALVPKDAIGEQPWLETTYSAEPCSALSFNLVAPDDEIAIGALRFNLLEIERRILTSSLSAKVEVVADDMLGSRLIVGTSKPNETQRALLAAGLPRIIASAVQYAEPSRVKHG